MADGLPGYGIWKVTGLSCGSRSTTHKTQRHTRHSVRPLANPSAVLPFYGCLTIVLHRSDAGLTAV
jgi:hypothetical protein